MTLDTLSLPANGGNADTVDGKDASNFVETSKVLTTKEQIEANTDASNVAGAVAVKEINSLSVKNFNITPITNTEHLIFAKKFGNIYSVCGRYYLSSTLNRTRLFDTNFDTMPSSALASIIPISDGTTFIKDSKAHVIMRQDGSVYCDYSSHSGFLFLSFTYIS